MAIDAVENGRGIATLKEYIVFAPLIGSTIAVAFNIGFFFGVDITYFSAFSLIEHVVFSLQAAPFATLLVGTFVIETAVLDHPRISRIFETPANRRRARIVCFVGLAALIFITAIAGLYVSAAAITVAALFIIPVLLETHKERRAMHVFVGSGAFWVVTSFLVGDLYGTRAIRPGPASHVLIGSERIDGRLIRSGERGVLFYDTKANLLMLVRWDSIKQIARVAASSSTISAAP